MSIVAIYNLKGGVGKTTAAVNLSYLSAAAGARTLLWDLDPQGASSFAFRIQASVAGFGKKSLKTGRTLAAAIKASDFERLDLLPADFAYRKLDRLLADGDNPHRAIAHLIDALGRDYDDVVLDCPPGFSLLTEAVFAASDLVLVPTIPTVLSLRTLARLHEWAQRNDRTPALTAFLSMVDRRKTLHRRACQWASLQTGVFLASQVPYASIVEQMAVRRMPLPAFAPGDPAAIAFRSIWEEMQARLQTRGVPVVNAGSAAVPVHAAIDALIAELESASSVADADRERANGRLYGDPLAAGAAHIVHSFDTDRQDLKQCGCVLELHERSGSVLIVAARSNADHASMEPVGQVHVQIDSRWAMQILSGVLSPLAALERRLGQPTPALVARLNAAAGDRRLLRITSLMSDGKQVAARSPIAAEPPAEPQIACSPSAALA